MAGTYFLKRFIKKKNNNNNNIPSTGKHEDK